MSNVYVLASPSQVENTYYYLALGFLQMTVSLSREALLCTAVRLAVSPSVCPSRLRLNVKNAKS